MPDSLRVADCVVGVVWTMIATDGGDVGMSLTNRDGLDESTIPGTVTGRCLNEVAGWLARWNPFEASIGCAALNAALNTRSRLEALTGCRLDELNGGGTNIYRRLATRFAGGKVAVIGRFPTLEPLEKLCELTVLERCPGGGDLPDAASEWILPEQDCVCITGTAVANKTLPRLLELSRRAYVVLIGPSLPMSSVWFDHGVDLLAGTVVIDQHVARRSAQEGAHRRLFQGGVAKVELTSEMVSSARAAGSTSRGLRPPSRAWHDSMTVGDPETRRARTEAGVGVRGRRTAET